MIPVRHGLSYGLLGFPLAFAALPLYVHLPNYYAREFSVPLGTLGALLMAARLFDAFVDPWIGTVSDRLFARSTRRVLVVGGACALVLAAGFFLLFFPPATDGKALLAWASLGLVMTYFAFSLLTVMHQAWGAMLATDDSTRSRYVAWREGLGLCGVLLATVAPTVAGWEATGAMLVVALLAGWFAWRRAPRPVPVTHTTTRDRWLPLRDRRFRLLLGVLLLNGIASALPATLVLFFVQDRLAAPESQQPLFLGVYFLAAAISIPVWLRVADRVGLGKAWLAGMLLAIGVFSCAAFLGAGDGSLFIAVCFLSGAALGADLAVPGAMLARVIDEAGLKGRAEGLYFGWWNLASKLNLAAAAGLALPLLSLAGYSPGTRSATGLAALTLTYCALPCVLKCVAAAVLHLKLIRRQGG